MNTFNIMESFQVFILLPFSIYIFAIHRILEFNKYIQCKMQKKCFVLVHFFISHFCVVLQTADKRAAWFMMEIWFSTEICLEYMSALSAKTSCHLAKKRQWTSTRWGQWCGDEREENFTFSPHFEAESELTCPEVGPRFEF